MEHNSELKIKIFFYQYVMLPENLNEATNLEQPLTCANKAVLQTFGPHSIYFWCRKKDP